MDENLPLDKIIRNIKANFSDIKLDNILELAPYFQLKKVKKKEILIKEGKYFKDIVFVIEGLFRAFYIAENQENTLWFREESSFFASHHSIVKKLPSKVNYQAIEDSFIATLDYQKIREMCHENQDLANMIITIMEHIIMELISRVEDFTTMSSDERYLNFLEVYPNTANRIPQQDLASYFGLSPVAFSRLKKRNKK